MPWNSSNKSEVPDQKKSIAIGAPMAYSPNVVGKPYKDGWDIERAYTEGVAKVTWVFRCIDAIAGNQSRLPMILRKDNSPSGEIVEKDPLLEVLNSRANIAEDSMAFRYRLSAQLLMGTRGAFVEVIRNNKGEATALHLLPPQSTAPIPHKTKFVSGYEVDLGNGEKKILTPEKVIWLRRPHPLDPYLSFTPLEAAGIAIEMELLAKLYNRNFLLNDGRPGGLVVLRGEIDDDDKEELRTRFGPNLARTGHVGVIASDDGADFVDLGSNPRDAAYVQQRQITKEEILAAFGVPESIIGNASGRTFSNAAEEGKVFWMETMLPHLQLVSRPLDALHEDYYIDFETKDVPILIIAKQERERFLMDEYREGLRSANEYRDGTGKKKVKSELADALLADPNKTPIGNTEKEMKMEQEEGPKMPLDVLSGEVPVAGQPGGELPPGQEPGVPPPESGGGEGGEEGLIPVEQVGAPPAEEPVPAGQLSAGGKIETKETPESFMFGDDWGEKTAEKVDQWSDVVSRTLERFFERQQRVILEKAGGKKIRRAFEEGKLPPVEDIFDEAVWNKQLVEDLQPVVEGIIEDAAEEIGRKAQQPIDLSRDENVQEFVDQQMSNAQLVNSSTKDEIAGALLIAHAMNDEDDENDHTLLKIALLAAAIKAIFVNVFTKRKERIVDNETLTAYNAGLFFAGNKIGVRTKTWLTRKDDRVRHEHRGLEGDTVPLKSGFKVGDFLLRFPKDPLAPPHLTMGCRCTLKFGRE